MSRYQEITAEIEKLKLDAQAARQSEIADVIADIHRQIKLFGLTAADLGFNSSSTQSRKVTSDNQLAKYRGPNNELWRGGRGPKPKWVMDVIARGGDINQFKINS